MSTDTLFDDLTPPWEIEDYDREQREDQQFARLEHEYHELHREQQ